MKKIYSLVLAAVTVLSAASCQKELVNAPEVENGEKFTVVATAAETKTVLEGNVAYWMPGDKITIFDAAGAPVVFTTNITEKAAKAEFTAESFNAPDSLVAVYNPTRPATLENGKIYPLRAGGDQKPVAGSFDPNAAIAVGGSKAAGSNELVFNNIHSLVKFTVGDVVPSSVKVVNNGGSVLVGLVYWNVEAAAMEHSGSGESSVTVSGTYEKGQTYYISVLPNQAKGGLSVYFDDVLVKNTGADITLQPNTIYNLGTLPAPAEPEVPAGFKAGNYWIVADNNYAKAITSNYGYLNVQAEGTTANVFTFAAVNGGYTLQQADGKYLYMKGTYNSFNVSADLPAEGHIWTVAENADGTYTISNTLNDKYIQYSVGYNSYGCYIDEQGLMPVLVDASGATDGPVEEPEQPGAPVVVTVAEFLAAAEDATVYQLTGEITSVTNTVYGNFYLNDGTGEVLIYGLCSPTGETKYWEASGVKVGDTITVQTVRSSYNGTPQGKNAIYVSHVAGEGTEPEEPETPVTPEIPEDATGFVMVTSEQADWSGQYLIVWGTAAHATLNNKDLNKTADVTVENGVIAYDSSLAAAVMTVVKNGADYNMKFADGKYFGMQPKGCKSFTQPFALGFEYTAAGVKISGEATDSGNTSTYYLYENFNQDKYYYRCYVDKKGQKGYTFPTLYKLK